MENRFCDLTKWEKHVRHKDYAVNTGEREEIHHCEIWSDAIELALRECGRVEIPDVGKTIWLDRPIELRSGNALRVAKEQKIALLPWTNTCMVRNANIIVGREHPVQLEDPDCDILVEGGIWTTLSTTFSMANGNADMGMSAEYPTYGHGVMLFSNVKNLTVRNVQMHQCKSHGVQISNCENFVCEDIQFVLHRRDGIHVDGPVKNGIIRRISGEDMGDDMIALNAWDWYHTVLSFGSIENVVVEDIEAKNNEIRLLPGRKRYADGTEEDCNISNCEFRRIRGIRAFKLYPQPNTEQPQDRDVSAAPGEISNVAFSDILFKTEEYNEFSRQISCGLFHAGANLTGAVFRRIRVEGTRKELEDKAIVVLKAGPLSYTHRITDDPANWQEAFSPDSVCHAEGIVFENVVICGEAAAKDDPALYRCVKMQINADYPNSTPRGGIGYGTMGNVTVRSSRKN